MKISAILILWYLLIVNAVFALEHEECVACHTQKEPGKPLVNMDIINNSIHNELECMDCHENIAKVPHDKSNTKVHCGECHDEADELYQTSAHARAKQAATCIHCHGTHGILSSIHKNSRVNRKNSVHTCAQCHNDRQLMKKSQVAFPNIVQAYRQSIHSASSSKNGVPNAVCADCHNSHATYRLFDMRAKIFKTNVPQTCGVCHKEIYNAFSQSIHGRKLAQGVPDAPSCTDCHGEHLIRSRTKKDSPTFATNIPKYTCAQCHGVKRFNEKYGLAKQTVETYMQSYHGLAFVMGDYSTANCVSCHGVHNILPSSNPQSLVHSHNLSQTCGQCHPNAGSTFARASIHSPAQPYHQQVFDIIEWFYVLLIIIVVGAMLFHNSLHFGAALKERYRQHLENTRRHAIDHFNRNMVLQHAILVISFTVLANTGFALKYSNEWWAVPFTWFEYGPPLRNSIHRMAGAIFCVACLYHLYFIVFTQRGRREIMAMCPHWQDIRDAYTALLHYAGLRKQKLVFGKYSYVEKLEYWALVWGAIIMIATGLLLWFENFSMNVLNIPKWVLDAATLVHFYEAVLATLAIIVWHLYHVIFAPEIFPTNFTWLTGKKEK